MLNLLLKHAHSGIRWIALALLLITLINSIYKLGKNQSARDKFMNSLVVYVFHLQLLIGLLLYITSPKVIFSGDSMSDRMLRFFLVEHLTTMVIAIVLITVGNGVAKKASVESAKHKRIVIFYGLALLLVLLGIPWPWQGYATGWF